MKTRRSGCRNRRRSLWKSGHAFGRECFSPGVRRLRVELLGRGFAWLDTGTHESLQQAADYVKAIQERQGLKIACIEEIAYRKRYINHQQMKNILDGMDKNTYREYLEAMVRRIGL